MPSFQLFTSIRPPTNADEFVHVRDSINSWRAAGFDAVAVAGPKDAEALRQFDLEIELAPLRADGKPRIGAILSAIRQSGARFAGIINSDCKIIKYPNLALNLRAGLDGTVALASPIELSSYFTPEKQLRGFDAHFFDTSIMPPDDCGFSMGEPWWDYWFPIACEMNGARLETLTVPLLTRKDHPDYCSEHNFLNAGYRFWGLLQSWHQRGDMPKSLLEKIPTGLQFGFTPSKEQIGRLISVPPTWLFNCRPQTMAVMGPGTAEIEAMLRLRGRSIFNEMHNQAREEEFAHAAAELAQAAAELAEMRNSTCWRMTAPLRKAVFVARRIADIPRAGWTQIRRSSRPHALAPESVQADLTGSTRIIGQSIEGPEEDPTDSDADMVRDMSPGRPPATHLMDLQIEHQEEPTMSVQDSDLLTPAIDTVLWTVTTNCNLRCTYCSVSHPDYRGEDFDLARTERLADEFAAVHVRSVQINGHGETTMIPGWVGMCAAFDRHGINVCITSNFSKIFSDAEVDALAHMTRIVISIDTVDQDLLKKVRRRVDLRTILYNMTRVRLRAQRIGRVPHFNWQCTLSDAVISGLPDWFELGLLNGVSTFTLGNLIKIEGLLDSPRHPAEMDKPSLLTACGTIAELSRRAHAAGAEFFIQAGVIEGINESLARLGHNEAFTFPLPHNGETAP
jgi:hypothetical protein